MGGAGKRGAHRYAQAPPAALLPGGQPGLGVLTARGPVTWPGAGG
jgi:hypothetical protein